MRWEDKNSVRLARVWKRVLRNNTRLVGSQRENTLYLIQSITQNVPAEKQRHCLRMDDACVVREVVYFPFLSSSDSGKTRNKSPTEAQDYLHFGFHEYDALFRLTGHKYTAYSRTSVPRILISFDIIPQNNQHGPQERVTFVLSLKFYITPSTCKLVATLIDFSFV